MLNFGEAEIEYGLRIISTLRKNKVRAELYPDKVKFKKQISYALSKNIPYIIVAGEDEIKENRLTIKIMSSEEQRTIPLDELISFVNKEIKKS